MTFAQYFKASSYCLIGSGFAAIASTGGIDWISIALFAAGFLCSWFLDTARIRRGIPTWALNSAGLIYLPFCVIDYRLLSRSLLLAALHLLFFAAFMKLLTLSNDRDYVLLYLISFAELLAASTLTVNIIFAGCFFLFLFSGISTLILFEMRRTNAKMLKDTQVRPLVVPEQLRGTGLELFSPFPAGLMAAMAVAISTLILVVLVPIFFLLPRINSGLYKHPFGDKRYTSGFSEQVELGQIGSIKQSNAVVMRVKTDKLPSEIPVDLKWRGLAFEHYDGRSWKRSRRTYRPIPIQGRFYKLEDSTQGTSFIDQTFFVEALSTNVIFATHKALAISRDAGPLWRDDSETLYVSRGPDRKLRYSAVSDPTRPNPANISDLLPIPSDILQTYTQVPPEDPRIERLAREVTGSGRDKYAKAQALEEYLRSHYSYSLVLRGTPNSRDPLAMFLFEVRSGHCEYFASAMTIMLRQLGIPARLVNGFRIGEYNAIADSWTVRQYDAHSWVEAYFPPYGWIEFDPTPPDPEHPRTALIRWISNLADAVDLWWWEGIVNYDRSKQSRVIGSLGATIENARHSIQALAGIVRDRFRDAIAVVRSPETVAGLVSKWKLWLALLTALILAFITPMRRRILGLIRRSLSQGNPRVAAVNFYKEALALLGTKGMKRVLGQTPMEFAWSLGNHPAGMPFLSLTGIYNAVRFGPPDAPFDHAEAEALLRELRGALKSKSPV
jgi:protein-glutamine gamma-glutamyltransferase